MSPFLFQFLCFGLRVYSGARNAQYCTRFTVFFIRTTLCLLLFLNLPIRCSAVDTLLFVHDTQRIQSSWFSGSAVAAVSFRFDSIPIRFVRFVDRSTCYSLALHITASATLRHINTNKIYMAMFNGCRRCIYIGIVTSHRVREKRPPTTTITIHVSTHCESSKWLNKIYMSAFVLDWEWKADISTREQ